MQYEKAHHFIISQLESKLPDHLTYHNVTHTKNVIAAVEELAEPEGVSGDDLVLLRTAALFHDAGFLQDYREHEKKSCVIAREMLPQFEYNADQIESICTMIMATRLPQTPVNHLSQILCDADLYYIGSNQYEVNAEKLFSEFSDMKIVFSKKEWEQKQIDFLSTHRFFTKTAIKNKEQQKQINLQQIITSTKPVILQPGKIRIRESIQDFLLIAFGVVIAGFALKGFLVPNQFFDGGITGISLLIHELYHFNLAIVIIVLNLPLISISYFSVGSRFAYRTILSVVLLGISLWLLPEVALTNDKLLISIFGGVFLGTGIGLIMRAGAALDGIEVLALYTLKKTSFSITEIILGINVIIFSIAAFNFGIETALYSILTYFAATRSIDYVVEGLQAYTGVTIISGKSEAIKYQLVNRLGRGITVYKGERGFLPGKFEVSADCDIIFTVITRLELRKLRNLVYEVDPKAFVFANTIKEASGGIIKRRNKH